MGLDTHGTISCLGHKTVLNRIFHNRLQAHFNDDCIHHILIHADFQLDSVFILYLHDVEILPYVADFLFQRNHTAVAANQVLHLSGQAFCDSGGFFILMFHG